MLALFQGRYSALAIALISSRQYQIKKPVSNRLFYARLLAIITQQQLLLLTNLDGLQVQPTP